MGRQEFTSEQKVALQGVSAGRGDPLALAKILRPVARSLDTHPSVNADTEPARTVRGLLRISNPDAFAFVASGQVPVGEASELGHRASWWFACHSTEVYEGFQLTAMTALAGGKSLDAIEEIANSFLNDISEMQEDERRRVNCERIWREADWSYWQVVSWIAFRDPHRLLEIDGENNLRRKLSWYPVAEVAEAKPKQLLLEAVTRGELKVVKSDIGEVPRHYWLGKHDIDRDGWFDAERVRRLWPGRDLAALREAAEVTKAAPTVDVSAPGATVSLPEVDTSAETLDASTVPVPYPKIGKEFDESRWGLAAAPFWLAAEALVKSGESDSLTTALEKLIKTERWQRYAGEKRAVPKNRAKFLLRKYREWEKHGRPGALKQEKYETP